MKETLRSKIEDMLSKIVDRINFLENSIKEYKEVDNFENAMKCSIKVETLKLVEKNLRETLS